MKILYEKEAGSKHLVLAIKNEDNYVLYDSNKPRHDKRGTVSYEYKYFSQMLPAIREVSRLCANEVCYDLNSWVNELRGVYTELEALLTVKA